MTSNYEVGTRAWQPDPTEGWVPSELVSKNVDGDKATLVFQLENGEVILSVRGCRDAIVASFRLQLADLSFTDEIHRGVGRGPGHGIRSFSSSFDEPSDARSQR